MITMVARKVNTEMPSTSGSRKLVPVAPLPAAPAAYTPAEEVAKRHAADRHAHERRSAQRGSDAAHLEPGVQGGCARADGDEHGQRDQQRVVVHHVGDVDGFHAQVVHAGHAQPDDYPAGQQRGQGLALDESHDEPPPAC